MSGWEGSTRRDRLPDDWPVRRKRIWKRDKGKCQVKMFDGRKCLDIGSDVDHKVAGDDHSDENLQVICEWHHAKKSSSEGGRAMAAKRKQIHKRFRRVEQHPGFLD